MIESVITAPRGADMTGVSDDKDLSESESMEALEAVETAESALSGQIRRFLNSRNVARHKHVSVLREALQATRQTVHRKFTGESTWSASDIETMARRFGVSVAQLTGSAPDLAHAHVAVIRIPRFPSTGLLTPGEEVQAGELCDLVATHLDGGWEVFEARKAPKDLAHYSVRALVLSSAVYLRVAVLEDNVSAAEALRDAFLEYQIQAVVFHRTEELIADLASNRFQAYVLDWSLDQATAEAALAGIREMESQRKLPRAPIFVATGMLHDKPDLSSAEQVLVKACDRYMAELREKPIRPSLLNAQIRRALDMVDPGLARSAA